jgi:hypothetical protein
MFEIIRTFVELVVVIETKYVKNVINLVIHLTN